MKPKKPNGFEKSEGLFSKPKKPDKEEDDDKEKDNDKDNDVDADKDINFSKVVQEYENNIAPATAMSKEILQSYCTELGSELVIEAIRRASLANKRSCKYIQGILNSWITKGYKTLIEVKNEKAEFNHRNNSAKQNDYDQRSYKDIDFSKLYVNLPPGENK